MPKGGNFFKIFLVIYLYISYIWYIFTQQLKQTPNENRKRKQPETKS